MGNTADEHLDVIWPADVKTAEELEQLYLKVFAPPVEQLDSQFVFKQVSLYDESLMTYTTDSTVEAIKGSA